MHSLNDNQLMGVTTTEGPLLILAGAGSGKTRVLTERIAYLISEKGVDPSAIMAITFTNKAAAEMKSRAHNIAGPGASRVWIATFHSSCVRILRKFADRLGYTPNFTIYDTDDSKAAMKEVLKRLNIDSKKFPERAFLSKISSAKDNLETPADVSGYDPISSQLAKVYTAYNERLLSQNAMDFDDLIVKTVELFRTHPDVLGYYQDRLKYFMVDEYQDTNTAQFELVRLLSQSSRNICVVGDDDQSIYKFRGANIYNILNFEKYFPEAVVIRLEENYRSTSQILNAANAVIKNNVGRKEKALWTSNPDGEEIEFKRYDTAYEEAEAIARDIANIVNKGALDYSDCAILYRTNAQSRLLEEKLLIENIPYRIVGGTNFYQRKEIKDVLAYLRALNNPKDDVSLFRIINVPRRGIGDTTIEKIANYAVVNGYSFYEALCRIDEVPNAGRAASKIKDFVDLIKSYRKNINETKVSVLIEDLIQTSGYVDMLNALDNSDEATARLENIGELVTKAVAFEEENPEGNLGTFLEEVSLIADIDSVEDDENRVLLMTLHSSKGLEFANVYISGMEEGLFPGMQAMMAMNDSEIEEERRLCYVGVTRAKIRLTLTAAKSRMVRGEYENHTVSRFIKEMGIEVPKDNIRDFKSKYDTGTSVKYSIEQPSYKKSFKRKFDPATLGTKIEKADLDYSVNDRVEHLKFGQGKVVNIVDGGRDYEVTVEFDNVGVKRMYASFARLKKI